MRLRSPKTTAGSGSDDEMIEFSIGGITLQGEPLAA